MGDAALGLRALRGEDLGLSDGERAQAIARYRVPEPRLGLGMALPGSAAIDVSDGLIADLGHICTASGLGARIEAGRVPLSGAARSALRRGAVERVELLTGGDDYELVFTAPSGRANAIREAAARTRIPLARIGRMTEGEGVSVFDEAGAPIAFDRARLPPFLGRATPRAKQRRGEGAGPVSTPRPAAFSLAPCKSSPASTATSRCWRSARR